MSSPRKIAANRANARRSTGPRTAAGRARSARNAVRHGLSVAVHKDAELYALALALARRLADEGGPFELAWAVAEATVEAWRVRRRRHEVITDTLRTNGPTCAQVLTPSRLLARAARALSRGGAAQIMELLAGYLAPKPNRNERADEREVRLLTELGPELRRLDRYERRALSRRKVAMRAFDAARAKHGSTRPPHAAVTMAWDMSTPWTAAEACPLGQSASKRSHCPCLVARLVLAKRSQLAFMEALFQIDAHPGATLTGLTSAAELNA